MTEPKVGDIMIQRWDGRSSAELGISLIVDAEQDLPPLKAIVEVVKAADSTNEHVGAYGHVVGYDRTSQCGQTPGDPMLIVSFSGGGQGRFWKEELVELVRKESP